MTLSLYTINFTPSIKQRVTIFPGVLVPAIVRDIIQYNLYHHGVFVLIGPCISLFLDITAFLFKS